MGRVARGRAGRLLRIGEKDLETVPVGHTLSVY